MKSEKAKAAIDRYRKHCTGCVPSKELTEYCRLFTEVAEIAEQEAEERMRLKAQKALCYNCSALCFKPQECNLRQSFIQKLNEE